MKSIHTLIFLPLLIFVISCDTTGDPTPDESPDLPVITDFEVAQSQWAPQWITFFYDSVSNSASVSSSNEESFWNMRLENSSEPKIDFKNQFNIDDFALSFPDEFSGTFGLKSSEPGGGDKWRGNTLDELVIFEITKVHYEEKKGYCSGRIDFYTRGDQNPFTLRIRGSFENVRIFVDENEARNYRNRIEQKLVINN